MTENDDHVNDYTQVQIDCRSIQLGDNGFTIVLEEDSGVVTSVADVTETAFGWMFDFLGAAGDAIEGAASGKAEYVAVFKATQPCTNLQLDDQAIYPAVATTLQVKSFSAINDRIRREVAAPAPIVKLENGTKIELQSKSLKFESFITDDDFKDYAYFKSGSENSEQELLWWYIALPVVIVGLVIFSAVFVYLSHMRRRVFVMKEQEILEKKIADVEKKGVEIPDDLKKVKTRIIKDSDLRKSLQDHTNDELRQSQVRASINTIFEMSHKKLNPQALLKGDQATPVTLLTREPVILEIQEAPMQNDAESDVVNQGMDEE